MMEIRFLLNVLSYKTHAKVYISLSLSRYHFYLFKLGSIIKRLRYFFFYIIESLCVGFCCLRELNANKSIIIYPFNMRIYLLFQLFPKVQSVDNEI